MKRYQGLVATISIFPLIAFMVFFAAAAVASAYCNPSSTQQKLLPTNLRSYDRFGYSSSVSGNWAIIGAPWFGYSGYRSTTGSAYLYQKSGSGWSQAQQLFAPDRADGDIFGLSVAISGDYAISGAFGDDDRGTNSGSAYIFERSSNGWWGQKIKLLASDGQTNDYFGSGVAISGEYALVGASGDDSSTGSAYVFRRTGGTWQQVAKITATDRKAGDSFGVSVSLAGNVAVIGASGAGNISGAAYIFENVSGLWRQVARITAYDAQSGDAFGDAVSAGTDTVLVGAYGNDDYGDRSGSAYVFERSGGSWRFVSRLYPGDPKIMHYFGRSVAIQGDYALVGASFAGNGAAYLFKKNGAAWSQVSKLTASDGRSGDSFGSSVAISDTDMIVGAYADDDRGEHSGTAYAFQNCFNPDNCPLDPNKTEPGICGCGVPDSDSDGDGVLDCLDDCPADPLKTSPGICGCGSQDVGGDSDGDGVADCVDGCPADPLKASPGPCGCGTLDTDGDNDGTADCRDECPADPGKTAPGTCGCGIPDTDSDANGLADCLDQFPCDNVLRVPADYPTIQQAISAASAGDVVLVDPGVYYERVSVYKAITLGSLFLVTGDQEYIDQTVISGALGYQKGGLAVANVPAGGRALVSGFTIRDTVSSNGGGVLLAGNHHLDHLKIIDNTANYSGGGMYVVGGSPLLTDMLIARNRAGGSYGGAGGGIYFSGYSGTDKATLRNVVIADNWAGWAGGGVYLDRMDALFENAVVAGNTGARAKGGGIISISSPSRVTVRNSIIRGNSPNELELGNYSGNGITFTVEYSNILGNYGGVTKASGGTLEWLAGNIDASPLWMNAGGDDYRLRSGSPGIDGGNPGISYNDGCLPPGLGSARNDMGVSGGPGNCSEPPISVECMTDDCPHDPDKTEPGLCGCGIPDLDSDQDGLPDCQDGCPDDPGKTGAGTCGCGIPDQDGDGDGTPDCIDGCPLDGQKSEPGVCGCGAADTDGDADRTPDCIDACPDDPGKIEAGACGCGVADSDSDGDGAIDCLEACPNDPAKTEPGACGCGIPDSDFDGDGALDCQEGCPDDPAKTEPGVCGCGISEADGDYDGIPDCIDPPSPDDLANSILDRIRDMALPNAVTNSYLANLNKMEAFVDSGKTEPALNQVNAFIQKVNQDLRQGKVSGADAERLLEMATALKGLLTT